ncbi:hypothetical protein BDA99DRAFT_532562 [Phascolomyces articulosus]|uniref:Uncharacterized protein n=1 Tax=Phascolomyces articulosus TaxID=60185 RepID=A0AAD5K9H8_9FUNG|nr:hypothetical protein BDA99DRAFT_532562 [Phascolomyces articulosus]
MDGTYEENIFFSYLCKLVFLDISVFAFYCKILLPAIYDNYLSTYFDKVGNVGSVHINEVCQINLNRTKIITAIMIGPLHDYILFSTWSLMYIANQKYFSFTSSFETLCQKFGTMYLTVQISMMVNCFAKSNFDPGYLASPNRLPKTQNLREK